MEVASIAMSVTLGKGETKSGKSKRFEIVYRPTSPKAFDATVKALKEAGFEEGLHFTAK